MSNELFTEVSTLIQELDHESAFMSQEFSKGGRWESPHDELDELGITYECVDSYGGEDQGSDYYSVYKFTKGDHEVTFIKFQGWYASHYGSEFREMLKVKPVEKLVTVFE